ncbi:MAG: DUF937 domain-containing protein [Burkholderiaceae bacterium]
MAINLLEMLQGSIGNDVIGQIGGLLGEDEKKTGSAVGAALPSILGGLMNQASTPAGAQSVFDSSKNFDGGMLDNLAGTLGGGGHSSLIETGTSLLGSIFGGNQSGLIGSIARMAGIGQGSAGSLLGLLAPIVMSAISKVSASNNFDASTMAGMLASQKDHVASAIPADLAKEIGLSDLLSKGIDGVRDAAGNVAGAASNAAGSISAAADRAAGAATDTARSGGGLIGKLLPLVILAAIAWFAYQFFAGSEPTMPDKPAMPAISGVEEIGSKVTTAMGDMTTAIGGIKDADSATAALDQLKGASEGLGGLSLDSLPDAVKGPLAGIVAPLLEKLQSVLETAYAIPGVKDIIEPVIGPVLEKLTALAA